MIQNEVMTNAVGTPTPDEQRVTGARHQPR